MGNDKKEVVIMKNDAEQAEYLYDIVMAICIDFMESTGDMIKCESLINFILEYDNIDEAIFSIIPKLYSSDKFINLLRIGLYIY